MTDNEPEITIPEPEPDTEQRVAYHRDLAELASGVMRLGAMACEAIPRGTEALLGNNLSDAQDLIDGDDVIDHLAVELEERCYSVIALQAPMAGELRRIITIAKLVAEIERSADLMVNVCKAGRRMYGAELTPRIRGVLTSMANEANKLLRLSLDAFADELPVGRADTSDGPLVAGESVSPKAKDKATCSSWTCH